jgi:hypothetical protein
LLFEETPLSQEKDLITLLEARHRAVHKGVDVPRKIAKDGYGSVKLYLDKIMRLSCQGLGKPANPQLPQQPTRFEVRNA